MSERLLPCPFCGGKGRLHPFDPIYSKRVGDYTYTVDCENYCSRMTDYETEAAAITAWNRRAIPLPKADIGARYCTKCFGLLVDASGHVLNEHLQGCEGDDWPVVPKWLVLTDSIAAPLPEDVAGLVKSIDDPVNACSNHGSRMHTCGLVIARDLTAALESQSRERAVLAEGFKAIMRYQGTGVTKQLFQSLYLTADWDAIQAALALIREQT